MAKRKLPSVQGIENSVIELSDNKNGSPTKKEKRDKTSSSLNRVKKLQADAAMGTPLEETLSGKSSYKNEYVNIEDDLTEPEWEVEDTQEETKVARYDENGKFTKEHQEILNNYKKKKIVGDSKILDGIGLTQNQRQFIVNLCDPDSNSYNDKFAAFMEAGYSAKTKHVLISNVSKLLGNKKVKEGIQRYRKDIITSKKLEISAETVDILRRRATYDVKYFYKDDGSRKPLNEIADEWRCCIDAVDTDYKGATAQQKVVKYKICDRQKALTALNSLLEVQQALSDNRGVGAPENFQINAALDAGKDKDGNQGPRVIFNISGPSHG